MSTPDRLELPELPKHGAGWVEFNDFDNLSGADYRKIRKADGGESKGEMVDGIVMATAEVMIRDWDIPYRPGLQLPHRDRRALDRLAGRHLYLLEKELLKMATRILEGNEEEGDPQPPATD